MTLSFNYNGCELIYTIFDNNKALVGTNKTTNIYNAAASNTGYTSITIPETISDGSKTYTVTEIGVCAFYGHTTLNKISFPKTLVQINMRAFDYALFEFTEDLLDYISFVGDLAFASNHIEHVHIGKNIKTILTAAFSYSRLSCKIDVDSDNEFYSSDEYKALFDKSKRRLIQVPRSLTSYTIPSSVEQIDISSFASSEIEEIIIPIGVKKIGVESFCDMVKLKKVIIHGNIAVISDDRFQKKIFYNSKAIANFIYCGSKFVDGDHFDVSITVSACVGYKRNTFGGKNVSISNECAAIPIYKCSCRINKMSNHNNLLLLVLQIIYHAS